MIEVKALTKRFVGRTAVDAVSFEVGKGEIVGVLGPNGAGKTTTMRMLTGYLPPTSGTARVAGNDVFLRSVEARRQIGYMPENVPLYEEMRTVEYLTFRAKLKGMSGRAVTDGVNRVVDLCSLGDVRKKLIGSLSKGYRQRVGLADALVHRPALLILDEPTNGLDPAQIRQVRTLISQLSADHTILLSTHILSEVEMSCGRVIIIHKGKLRADDTPANLTSRAQGAGTVTVELDADTAEAESAFNSIAGVRRATGEALGGGWARIILKVEPGHDVREEAARLAADKQWTVRELSRASVTLEDVFIEITQRD